MYRHGSSFMINRPAGAPWSRHSSARCSLPHIELGSNIFYPRSWRLATLQDECRLRLDCVLPQVDDFFSNAIWMSQWKSSGCVGSKSDSKRRLGRGRKFRGWRCGWGTLADHRADRLPAGYGAALGGLYLRTGFTECIPSTRHRSDRSGSCRSRSTDPGGAASMGQLL